MSTGVLSSPRRKDSIEDHDVYDFNDEDDYEAQATDEDTDDASETENVKKEEKFTEIKEQMYQDKLAQLKKQLQQLKEETLPEYQKKFKKIEVSYKERLRLNEVWLKYELENIEREYIKEKKQAAKEFEQKKIELKESLIQELEDKRRHIEYERTAMDLNGSDPLEMKPISTRKLRRRPNDPLPMPEKRRKPSPVSQLNYILSEDDILEDLKIINKISGKPLIKKPLPLPAPASTIDNIYDARIDDGRLYYEKKWFTRGQPVYIESKEMGKVSAVVSAVGTSEVWMRKTTDNSKLRVGIKDIQRGKYLIRKRTS